MKQWNNGTIVIVLVQSLIRKSTMKQLIHC